MKWRILIIVLTLNFTDLVGQDIINPYFDHNGQLISDLNNSYNTGFIYTDGGCGAYDGEYEIVLDLLGWGNTSKMLRHWNFQLSQWEELYDLNDFALSYSVEVVSFPFALDCAFPSSSNPYGGCEFLSTREFTVPIDAIYSASDNKWIYPQYGSGSFTFDLWRKLNKEEFTRDQFKYTAISDESNALISTAFVYDNGFFEDRRVLPHTVLKHTVNIHCGPDINSQPIGSFEFYVDLTRGRYREFPFSDNDPAAGPGTYELVIRPVFINPGVIYNNSQTANCNYNKQQTNGNCGGGIEGSTVNYFPFDPTIDNDCAKITYGNTAEYNEWFMDIQGMHNLPLADYTIIGSTSPRSFYGETLAGYNHSGSNFTLLNSNAPIVHQYFVNNNIDLSIINNEKREIFNPSEVYITADNLRFPTNYTFKTIRGTYPFASDVTAANTVENGGPYIDPTNRDVPVETDLYKDFHITGSQYNPSDHKLASLYHLESGSKLTIEPCVKIFDATFEINPGSEMVFEDEATNRININRYALIYNGGTVTRQRQDYLLEDEDEYNKILYYKAANILSAGYSVDPNHADGNYVVHPNAEVNFISGNSISLEPGFEAKPGSNFTASIEPVIIPGCGPPRLASKSPHNDEHFSNTSSKIIYFTSVPNPVTSDMIFMFDLAESSNAIINVYNNMGKLVATIGEKSFLPAGKFTYSMPVEKFAAGLYVAKLVTRDSEASLKFVKQ